MTLPLLLLAALSPIVPFVCPSGKPSENEIRGIVSSLKAHGVDQFLLYPTTGLDYDYLGRDYFTMVATFLDAAERNGQKMWLYDEFNWPSGTARGRVPAENDAFVYRELIAVTNAQGTLSWQIVVSNGINVDNDCLDGNNFEPAGVQRFMDLTHRAYAERFSRYFGTVIPGIFTDEPGHCSGAWTMKLPQGAFIRIPYWSTMEKDYAAAYKSDFRTDFARAWRAGKLATDPLLARWTDLRGKQYRASYFDPITDWCRTNRLVSTGHLIGEGWSGTARVNGSPLKVLKGLSKPAIDLLSTETGKSYEWLTLAFAQSAALANGTTGGVELFGLGPCDIDFTVMRKMYWLCALHRIDTFFQATHHTAALRFMQKDSWAMFTSPTQPWYEEMGVLHAAAREAAAWAAKPFKCPIAVVYPQRASGRAAVVGGRVPPLAELAGALSWNGFTYELIEEEEKSERPILIDWEGSTMVERRSGASFTNADDVVSFLEMALERSRTPGLIERTYEDGHVVRVDARTGEVDISRRLADDWDILLSGPSMKRIWFWTSHLKRNKLFSKTEFETIVDASGRYPRDHMARLVLAEPLKGVCFALRHYPGTDDFTVKLDGRPLQFSRPGTGVPYGFEKLYRKSVVMNLAAGEHVFELSGGNDGKMYLPVLWMIGSFIETPDGEIANVPATLKEGSLAERGLGAFAGKITYRANARFAAGEKLVVDSGGAVVRVKAAGRDLGARGWAPFEWTIPAELVGREIPLEIVLTTSVRPVFGDETTPDAKLTHALWIDTRQATPPPAGLRSARAK